MSIKVRKWDGKPIDKPGVYSGIDMESYHGDLCVGPSVSKSLLWRLVDESPAHAFEDSYLNPDREEKEDSEALILGRGSHHLLLGEADFSQHFAIRPLELNGKAWNSNLTDCKEWLEAVREEGLTVLKGEHIVNIRGMSQSLAAHPLVRAGILNGLIEHSIVWQDRETGIWCKVRPDAIPTDAGDVADLKSAASVSDEAIERSIGDFGYFVQGAMIGMAYREVLGIDMTSFTLIYVEKKKPWPVRVKTLIAADLELGEQIVRAGLRLFARCLERNEWPGPGGIQRDAEYAQMTPWRRTAIERRLQMMEAEAAI